MSEYPRNRYAIVEENGLRVVKVFYSDHGMDVSLEQMVTQLNHQREVIEKVSQHFDV